MTLSTGSDGHGVLSEISELLKGPKLGAARQWSQSIDLICLTHFDNFLPCATNHVETCQKYKFEAVRRFFDVAPFRWPLLRSADAQLQADLAGSL